MTRVLLVMVAMVGGCGDDDDDDAVGDGDADADADSDADADADADGDGDGDADADADGDADLPPAVVGGFAGPESVLWDAGTDAWYVSNVAGAVAGDGYVSKLDRVGAVVAARWATGLNDPKGSRILDGTLWVADVTELVEIELATGQVGAHHPLEGAQVLNDVAVDAGTGDVYVSDTFRNAIRVFRGGAFETVFEDPSLDAPNGLLLEGETLWIVGLGADLDPSTFATSAPGRVVAYDLGAGTIEPLSERIGALDGIERDGDAFLVTDFGGRLLSVDDSGDDTELEDLAGVQGSTADLGWDPDRRVAALPDYLGTEVRFLVVP